MGMEEVRPAFYALRGGGWRDYVTLLHPPYTLWHLSYVAVGAALAPHFHLNRLLWALVSFFLAMGVAAHALDELKGRPLQTRIPSAVLVAVALVALANELLAMAEELDSDELRSEAHNSRGIAKWKLDDRSGIDDVTRSVELADAATTSWREQRIVEL